MYLDVPEDLKNEFEDYKFSIEEKRRLYWTAMKYTALPLVLFIVIVPFHITSDYVLFYVAIVFFWGKVSTIFCSASCENGGADSTAFCPT